MIYIQSNSSRDLPNDFDTSSAMYGAIQNCKNYRLTSYEEVSSGKFDSLISTRLFVGSVEFMKEVFNRVGLNDVKLPRNSNREFKTMQLGEVKSMAKQGSKMFIKPFDIKLFTGFVIDEMEHTSIANVPNDTNVMVYDVFTSPIESEWRLYIHNNKIVDSRNYSGDFMTSPNYDFAKQVIEENKKDFPISYTIDIGILENGENVVVEYNDMWAIGNYGVDNTIYLRLLTDRYFEIMRMKTNSFYI